MRRFGAFALATVLNSACRGGLPGALTDCEDTDCQSRWVEARWATDHAAVTAALRELPDPIARARLVRLLATAHPGETMPLCDLLPRGPAAVDCRERNHRPHLLSAGQPAPGEGEADEGGPGPETHGLTPSHALISPWASTAADILPCAVEARVCQSEEAASRAAASNTAGAAAACNGIEPGQWREECFFQAGEQAVRAGAPDDAVNLCIAAGTYAGRCLSHVVREVGALAPVASAGDEAAWVPLRAAVAGTGAVLQTQDPDLAARFTAQAWAWGLRSAYLRSDVVTGAPLAALPAEAAPHARAAAAWRIWTLERAQHRTLAEWTTRLSQALADRAPRLAGHPPDRQPGISLRNLWPQLLPGEAALTSTAYLGTARRAVAEDPSADAAICLLEAMAHGTDPPRDLLALGLHHADPTVRWTAARLLAAVSPGDRRLQSLARDPSPLVRARAGGSI